jgi:hypothetical protein
MPAFKLNDPVVDWLVFGRLGIALELLETAEAELEMGREVFEDTSGVPLA